MKCTKKLCSSLLATAMVLSMTPTTIFADEKGDIDINEENFPDANFRALLETFREGKDGSFSQEEIKGITSISYDGFQCEEDEKLTTLTGINYFTSLQYLDVSGNNLTTLDVESPELINLDCYCNQLTSLRVTSNHLEWLDCHNNQLTTLEASSENLDFLDCGINNLTTLDLSVFPNITLCDANNNYITDVNVENNPLLEICYYIPKEIKMDVKENFDYTTVPTMDAYISENADFIDITEDGLILDTEKKTISLKEGVTTATLTIEAYGDETYTYNYTFYYEEEKPEVKPDVDPGNKPEVKPDQKPNVKPEVKPEAKPEVKPETKPTNKPQADQEVPHTADTSNVMMYMMLFVSSAALLLSYKKRHA